jgi:hypothetical protein
MSRIPSGMDSITPYLIVHGASHSICFMKMSTCAMP